MARTACQMCEQLRFQARTRELPDLDAPPLGGAENFHFGRSVPGKMDRDAIWAIYSFASRRVPIVFGVLGWHIALVFAPSSRILEMPGGRPRRLPHAGGRPRVYHTDDIRKAARKASQRRWYFQPEVHERVNDQRRKRYSEREDQLAGGGTIPTESTAVSAIQPDDGLSAPEKLTLKRARDVHTQFTTYIHSSAKSFLRTTVQRVLDNYRPGHSAPLLDDIEEDLAQMLVAAQQALHDLLNSVGAWAEEYLEVQRIVDEILSVSRNITEIQCLAMEEALQAAVSQCKLAFLK
ncbi:hypothetical protein BDZ89DRAFT_1036140 [Hymenopellis radicata]|nr:hypothetical protein BDZ89DRAFT_1036140 [Hymenopellis radicata]